jgi:pimeloyl-ACP methyl ester carboxylesterase
LGAVDAADKSRLRVVPGLGLDDRSWRPTLTALSLPTSSVVTLPGFGEPALGADLSPPVLARLLLARLRPATSSVVLVGHSSSCQVVAHAARIQADVVGGLVLVGPTTDPRAASWPRLAARWLATAVHEKPSQVPLLAAQYRLTGLWDMGRAMDQARRDRIGATLAHVRCPVLVIRGPHDRICPEDWARSLSTLAVTLPGGGHMVPWTHGPATAAIITRFVTGL